MLRWLKACMLDVLKLSVFVFPVHLAYKYHSPDLGLILLCAVLAIAVPLRVHKPWH